MKTSSKLSKNSKDFTYLSGHKGPSVQRSEAVREDIIRLEQANQQIKGNTTQSAAQTTEENTPHNIMNK